MRTVTWCRQRGWNVGTRISRILLLLMGPIIVSLPGLSQSGAPAVEFEVATVKINRSQDETPSRSIRGSRIYLRNATLKVLLIGAYEIQVHQLRGAPAWFDSDRFDVVAKAPEDATESQKMVMLQNLLKKSFNLALHREDQLMNGYALVVSKQGLKLKESEAGKLKCTSGKEGVKFYQECEHATLQDIAFVLMRSAQDYLRGLHVIDSTGISGSWRFRLEWSGARLYDAVTADPGIVGASPDSLPVSFFHALKDQLGLRLERKKVLTPVFVVDHVDRVPVEN